MPKISIIIPVYNVEKYIEQCARSLFEQTSDDLEYIFINDCTPDHSMEVLKRVLADYPQRTSQVKILHNKENLKQSATRTRGMKVATGDYLIHCDPDDWVDKDYYQAIIQKINETKAEIIICDYITEYKDGRSRIAIYDNFLHPHDRIRMKRQLIWSLCCTAVKRTLIEVYEIYPPLGINMTEDFNMLVRACYYAQSIANMHGPMYHYRCDREDSIVNTSKMQKILVEQRRSLQQIVDFLKDKGFDAGEGMLISKRNMRDYFLVVNDYNNWRQTFPDVVEYVYNDKSLPKMYRALYKLAAEHWLFPFKVYRAISTLKRGQ